MMNRKRVLGFRCWVLGCLPQHPASVLNSSFIIPHSSFPFQLKAQAINLLHVVGLALGVGRGARVYAACDARAVEGEFARRAVEPCARAPVRKAAASERAE